MFLAPIILAIFSIIIVLILIFTNLIEQRLDKVSFVIFLVNTLLSLSYFFLFKMANNNLIINIYYAHLGVTILATSIYTYLFIAKLLFHKIYEEKLTKSLEEINNSFYFITNKNDKVIAISTNFLEELGLELIDVKKRNIFDVFNSSIRITHFDGVETNNNSLRVFYEDYKKTIKNNDLENREITFQNYQGKSIYLTIIEQPIFYLKRYRGRINIGKIQSSLERVGIESELRRTINDYESLRLKYIQTLKLSSDGFYYLDLDSQSIWLSEIALKMLGMNSEIILIEDFQKFIHKDDLPSLLGSLSNLTKKKISFKTRYRFLKNNHYIWVEDEGVRIFDDPSANIIMGKLKINEQNSYQSLGSADVDNLKTEKDIFYHLNNLFAEKRTFELALFELGNIPEINKEYGRDVGNMLINEYVKKLKSSFLSESSEIFRISGLVFAATIVDSRKMELLRTGLLRDPDFLSLEMNYGAINLKLEVFLGVASSYRDAKDGNTLYECATEALTVARHKDFKLNACYYGDLNE